MVDKIRSEDSYYQWPGGALNKLRPVEIEEAHELAEILRGGVEDVDVEAAALAVLRYLHLALMHMEMQLFRELNGKSFPTVDGIAEALIPLQKPEAGSVGDIVVSEIIKWLSKEDFDRAISMAGHVLVNSGIDRRERALTRIFCSCMRGCANEVLRDDWALPTTDEIGDANFVKTTGVLPFAKAAVPVLTERLRERFFSQSIESLDQFERTSERALRDAILKYRSLTMTGALEILRQRAELKQQKAQIVGEEKTGFSSKTRE